MKHYLLTFAIFFLAIMVNTGHATSTNHASITQIESSHNNATLTPLKSTQKRTFKEKSPMPL